MKRLNTCNDVSSGAVVIIYGCRILPCRIESQGNYEQYRVAEESEVFPSSLARDGTKLKSSELAQKLKVSNVGKSDTTVQLRTVCVTGAGL